MTDTKPTLEEQIEWAEVLIRCDSGIAPAVLASLKELAAIKSQPEPVAWMYHDGESPDKPPSQFAGSTLLSFERMPNYRNERPLYTAQQSGVREGDLARACNLAGLDYQVFLKIKAYLPVDAITRAADQVNTDTVSVPTVPTDAMRDAGNEIIKNRSQLFQAWNAMLRAAQEGKK